VAAVIFINHISRIGVARRIGVKVGGISGGPEESKIIGRPIHDRVGRARRALVGNIGDACHNRGIFPDLGGANGISHIKVLFGVFNIYRIKDKVGAQSRVRVIIYRHAESFPLLRRIVAVPRDGVQVDRCGAWGCIPVRNHLSQGSAVKNLPFPFDMLQP